MIIGVWVARNEQVASTYIRIYRALWVQGPELELVTGRHRSLCPSKLNRNMGYHKLNGHWNMVNCRVPMGGRWDNAGAQGAGAVAWWAGLPEGHRGLLQGYVWMLDVPGRRKLRARGRRKRLLAESAASTMARKPTPPLKILARLVVARCTKKSWIISAQVWLQENSYARRLEFPVTPILQGGLDWVNKGSHFQDEASVQGEDPVYGPWSISGLGNASSHALGLGAPAPTGTEILVLGVGLWTSPLQLAIYMWILYHIFKNPVTMSYTIYYIFIHYIFMYHITQSAMLYCIIYFII